MARMGNCRTLWPKVTFAAGFVSGVIAMWIFGRFGLRILRKTFSSPESTIRRTILDRMGYEGLLAFQRAIESELAKRQP